ncbi:MAG: hypothetical protein IJZ17_06405 [Muribaculaceae bacterium]|nr:hypothetical protein [Muribaculaceae bacterium]
MRNKRFLSVIVCISFVVSLASQSIKLPHMYAHRGCWTKGETGEFVIPENSVAAVEMAKIMGYEGIECDVHYTKDSVMVILHDHTLNRTLRRASDYSRLDEPIKLADVTFAELRSNYVLESELLELRTPVPTLEELLYACKRFAIKPMLHSALSESYIVAQNMFGDEWICFTEEKGIREARKISDCLCLLAISGGTAEENIARLNSIGGDCGVSTMNYKLLTEDFCGKLSSAGYQIQASIFPTPWDAVAINNGVTYQLTDYAFMPHQGGNVMKNFSLQNIEEDEVKLLQSDELSSCGGVVLKIQFEGKIAVEIDGVVTHELESNDGAATYLIGRRFTYSIPEVGICKKSRDTVIDKVDVSVYLM